MMVTDKVECPRCHKKVSKGNLSKHQGTKKCKNHDDKTAGDPAYTIPSKSEAVQGLPASVPAESQSKILKEINLNQEFEKMATKLNPKKEEKKGDMKYECGACGQQFNHAASDENGGKICPACGVELE